MRTRNHNRRSKELAYAFNVRRYCFAREKQERELEKFPATRQGWVVAIIVRRLHPRYGKQKESYDMAWSNPVIVEVCIGMEVTCYESAEI